MGQYTRRDWEGKANSEAELRQLIEADIQRTNALPKPQNQDQYGGLLNSGVTLVASTFIGKPGHFRAAKDMSGRWWLVTPLGNPYWQVGVTTVVPYGGSPVSGREELFEPVSPLAADGSYDFHRRNVDRYNEVAGPGASWESRTITRLQGWGFNSLGNWPGDELQREVDGAPRLPYTRTSRRMRLMPQTNFSGADPQPLAIFPGTTFQVPVFYTDEGRYPFPDVFSQPFLDYVLKDVVTQQNGTSIPGYFATPEVAKTNNDPYAIGVFVDNEIRWSGGERDENVAVSKGAINMIGSVVRYRFLQELAKTYTSIGALLSAWGVSLSSAIDNSLPVTALGPRSFVFPTNLNPTAQRDLNVLLGVYAEQYYSVVRQGFKAHMPNKLYLGSRLYEGTAPLPVLQAAAKYVDVLSINLYRKPIDVGRIDWIPFAALNKPLLIGEFAYIATDEGHFTGFHYHRDVATQAERGSLYQKYMDLISRNPLFVGASVYQYVDAMASGRPLNYENFNVGLVDVLELPYTEYVNRVADWNRGSYKSRLGQLPANHAPVLDKTVVANLAPIQQENRFSYGTPVWQLLTGVTDVDPKAERGIAVTWLDYANGNWQYTLDGGKSWFTFAPAGAASARLLSAAGSYSRIRFQPNPGFTGTAKIGFYAWDQKQGYTQGSFNLAGSGKLGSNKAFSSNYRSSSVLVTPAPLLNLSGSLGYVRNAPAVVLASAATVTYAQSAYLGAGQLRVQITAGSSTADRLTIGGPFTVSNGQVLLNGLAIGGLNPGGGAGSTALVVDFYENATVERVQALVRAIKFGTTTKTGQRTISFTLSDGQHAGPAAFKLVQVG